MRGKGIFTDLRLEIELEYTRRELSRNIIDLRDEREGRKKAETFIREI